MNTLPTNSDVVVIGAGAAGLSAAKALMGQGFEVLTLEAEGHVGGRCITDATTFNTPFDRGGSWLHSAEINPLARIAEARGDVLHKNPWKWAWVQNQGQNYSDEDVKSYDRYHEDMWSTIEDAGSGNGDPSIESILPPSRHRDVAKHWVAQMLGGDAPRCSTTDIYRYADTDGDWLVEGGYGAFVRSIHADVPVRLNSPVSKIEYAGPGVRVHTDAGVVEAKFTVITVSAGVLASESVTFDPPLPAEKRDALEQLPMGLLNKVGIEFDPSWAGANQGQMADYSSGDGEFCSISFGFYDTSLAVSFFAGAFADAIEAEGPGAATAYSRQALADIFGGDILKHVGRTSETAWRGNQFTKGSYSHALPGGADGRSVLAEPLHEKLFFAGEATIPTGFATVHGAYLSGIDAADAINALRG